MFSGYLKDTLVGRAGLVGTVGLMGLVGLVGLFGFVGLLAVGVCPKIDKDQVWGL